MAPLIIKLGLKISYKWFILLPGNTLFILAVLCIPLELIKSKNLSLHSVNSYCEEIGLGKPEGTTLIF